MLRTSTQVPFHVRRMVAPLLGLPVKRIRVIKPRIGGGFGGKQEMLIEDIVGHLVLATRRPVRLELTREEEFVSARTRHAQTVTFRTGVDAMTGKLVAQDMKVVANTGAYGVHGFTVQSVTGLRGLSSYNCPAKRYSCDVVYTNRLGGRRDARLRRPAGRCSHSSPTWTTSQRRSGIDPVELRRKNWVGVGDPLDIAPGSVSAAVPRMWHPRTCRASPAAAPRNASRRRCGRSAGTGVPTSRGNARLTGPASGGGSGFALCVHGLGHPVRRHGCRVRSR